MSTLVDHEITELCEGDHPLLDPFSPTKHQGRPSWGLSSAGYDVRLGKVFQRCRKYMGSLRPDNIPEGAFAEETSSSTTLSCGMFLLAETMETFHLPDDVYATVHDKSSWIRLGLSVHNTVIEPGWRGVLTLEIKNVNRANWIELREGDGIAQVMFHRLVKTPDNPYSGHYQDQKGVRVS